MMLTFIFLNSKYIFPFPVIFLVFWYNSFMTSFGLVASDYSLTNFKGVEVENSHVVVMREN